MINPISVSKEQEDKYSKYIIIAISVCAGIFITALAVSAYLRYIHSPGLK